MRRICLYISLLITGLSQVINAQQQMGSFMAYGPEAKYFSNLNYSVYQSKDGYLWIGTSNGLVRFDGKRYKNYFSNYADPNSPSDNNITDIAEDRHGNLWFAGFFHGATRYNPRTGEFKKYYALTKDEHPYYQVYKIFRDPDDNLWFATGGRGLALYREQQDSFELFFPEPTKVKDGSVRGDNFVTDINNDPHQKNILWCSSFRGLYAFDKNTKQFRHYPTGLASPMLPDITINSIEVDQQGMIWAGTWGAGILCFDPASKIYLDHRRQRLPPVSYDIQKINDSILYVAGLNDGLFQLNINTDRISNITPPRHLADPAAAKPDIQKISLTPDAGIFIGGNYYVYQQHPAFARLKKNVIYPDTSKNRGSIFLNACKWDEKRRCYWIATNWGPYRLNEDLTDFQPVKTVNVAGKNKSFFTQLEIDGKNRVWAIRQGNGLMQWNEELGGFSDVIEMLPLADTLKNTVWKIKADQQGNLWMAFTDKFIFFDIFTGSLESFPFEWSKEFRNNKYFNYAQLLVDPEGDAWLLSNNGTFHCRKKEKKVVHIFRTANSYKDLPSSTIIHGAFNKYNNLWFADQNNGMQVYDWKNYKVLSNHNLATGLPSMVVTSVVSDISGRIWANTTGGLAMFDPNGKKIWQLFNRLDGLEKDYLDLSTFITANNKLVIDQGNGFVIRDIEAITAGNEKLRVNITSIRVNDLEYQSKLLPGFITKLELDHDRNNIDLEFAAMDWIYPFKTSYMFMVEGLSSAASWGSSPESRISLVGLQPGNYKVLVKALSGSGVWSEIVSLPITIRPPFWKTWWFILFCITILGVFLYGIFRYRITQLKRVQSMRNSISRNLHDDIGASLSNIHILNELAKRNANDQEKSTMYLSKAGEDIQRISESLSDIVWNINPRYDDVENLFIRMKRYAADMMEGKNITASLLFPVNTDNLSMPMDQRRDFYLIFKESVNNLVKYSKATAAKVEVGLNDQVISMIVEDNGCGFDPESSSEGNGLHNMRTRADKWGASLDIVSGPGKGTKVKLQMKTR